MKKIPDWKITYFLCSLIFVAWMLNVSIFEFDRVNSQYRKIAAQLNQDQINSRALEELIQDCKKKLSAINSDQTRNNCESWPPQEIKAKAIETETRIKNQKKRAATKLVLFYVIYVCIFLLSPPLIIYLLVFGVIKLFKEIKIVR